MSTPHQTYKNRQEKIENLKEELANKSNQSNQREKNITLVSSLVKYDTPFLVSSSKTNAKTLEDLEENEENAELFLRNIINRTGPDGEPIDEFTRDYSVKDALNKILPPKKMVENDQICVKYVSCTPVTKSDVVTLQEGLDRKLQTRQARETGICPIRENLYDECFDELIRQVTLNCLERGILLMRIKKEILMTISSYQTLYTSSVSYGIRTLLIAEEEKKNLKAKIATTEGDCEIIEKEIKEKEELIKLKKKQDEEERKVAQIEHDKKIKMLREEANEQKAKLKNILLTFDNKD